MESAREIDDNGYLLVRGCPISSYGIFEYGAGQVGLPGDPNRIVKVFRPESAVSDQETINSFKDVPFIVDHEMLSGFDDDEDYTAPEDKGIDGTLTSNVYYEKPWMRGDLKIFSRKAQKYLSKNKRDLSLGYSCKFDPTPGVFDGQAYEVIQTDLRGNHIALVDEGRVPGAKVLDGLIFDHLSYVLRPSDEDLKMAKKTKRSAADSNAVEQLLNIIPALQQFLEEESAEPEHQEGELAPEGELSPEGDEGESESPEVEGAPDNDANTESQLPQLLAQVKTIISQIEASMGNGAQGEDEEEMNAQANDDDDDEEETGDESEGENKDIPVVEDEAEECNGKASPGPKAGKNSMAGDSSIRKLYIDLAAKSRIYERLSKVVGAFDHSTMDSRQVAIYGVKKIGIKASKGNELVALNAYLSGREAEAKKARNNIAHKKNSALDSNGIVSTSEIDAYIEGRK